VPIVTILKQAWLEVAFASGGDQSSSNRSMSSLKTLIGVVIVGALALSASLP
jgi:hypothetical protein